MKKYYPISPKQAEDWTYNFNLKPEYPPTLMNISLEIESIDPDAFALAFRTLIERHDSLRTTFQTVNGEVIQQVEEYTEKFDLIRLNEEFPCNPDQLLHETIFSLKNLFSAPLIKGFLFRKADTSYIIYILIHHIISDYWSINIIREQLLGYYRYFSGSSLMPDTSPQLQLGEYITRNEQFFSDHNRIIDAWRDKLSDKKWQVDFNNIYKHFADEDGMPLFNWNHLSTADLIANPTGETYSCFINEELNTAFRHYRRESRKSTNNIILTCMNILGRILTDSNTVLIQTHYINRESDEAFSIIGNLTGKILLLNKIDDEVAISSLQHQCDYSFYDATSKVILNSGALNPLELTTRCFLFYNFISGDMSAFNTAAIEKPSFKEGVWVESPLVCQAYEYENTIQFRWSYHLGFFNRKLISQIARSFECILEQIVCRKAIFIKDIDADLILDYQKKYLLS